MITKIGWLRSDKSKQILISGTNMPVTALQLTKVEEKAGFKMYKVGQDEALTEQLADNSEVLALAVGQNSTQVVTEEQILVIKPDGQIFRLHTHSVQACISKDYIVTVDELRKINIYNIAKQLEANEMIVARQFQLSKEVRSLSIAGGPSLPNQS